MKIFLLGDRKKQANLWLTKHVAKVVEDMGHKLDRTHVDSLDSEEIGTPEENFKQNLSCIKQNDILLVEGQNLSNSTSFLISKATSFAVPTILLNHSYLKISYERGTLKGAAGTKYLLTVPYNSQNLEQTLKKAIISAKKLLNTKFILNLPPDLYSFLEDSSHELRKSKASIVRESLLNAMNQDEDWQRYMEQRK